LLHLLFLRLVLAKFFFGLLSFGDPLELGRGFAAVRRSLEFYSLRDELSELLFPQESKQVGSGAAVAVTVKALVLVGVSFGTVVDGRRLKLDEDLRSREIER
jgi:hypothetical protein